MQRPKLSTGLRRLFVISLIAFGLMGIAPRLIDR